MVAAILHGDKGTGAGSRARGCVRGNVPGTRVQLLSIGDDPVHLGHGGDGFAFHLGGATCHQQPRIRTSAAGAANGLAGLTHRFRCDRATIHHDHVVFCAEQLAQPFAFGNIQPAAERADFRPAHR